VVEKRTGDRRTTGAAVARAVPVSAPHGWAMFDAASPALTTGTGSAATLRQRGAVATGIAPTPRSPAPLAAPAHGGAYGSRPTGTPPPAPAAAPARLRAVEAADADAFADAAPFSLADSAGIDDDAKDVGAFDAVRTYASLGSAVAPGTGQRSSLERTLEAQRASGLWDASAASLAATIDALRVLVREGLTTSHPVYGGNAKKAVEAVVAAAARASIPAAERELALLLAYLVASGSRSRAAVLEALRVHAPEAEARTQDEAALSAALLAPT
jgi:Ca-activated chloride channel family protein